MTKYFSWSVQQIVYKVLLLGILFFAATAAQAATLSVSPSTGVYTAGQTFTARVTVNTSGQTINAAEGVLSFNPSELSVVRLSKGSIFNLWTSEPSYSNSAGTITFSGGATPPGYKGGAGTALSITFRVKNAGNPRVTFQSGAVLAADGRGTNVLTSMSGGNYTIAAQEVVPEPETIEYIAPANTPDRPVISSATHTDPAKWYPDKTAELSWSTPTDVTAVRTLLDKNSGTIPTKVYDTPINTITLTELEEGVQYFHLQFKNSDGWGKVAHYRLAVDSVKPSQFTITLPENADLSNPEQVLAVNVADETSPVVRFLVQLDGAEAYEYIDEQASGTIALPSLEPGRHSVIVEAFDAAGNSIIDTFSFEVLAFDKPQFTEYPAEITEDVIPVIKGITRPDAEVTVTIQKLGNDAQTISLRSDATGEFVYIPQERFSLGVYELTAVAIDQYGAQSEMSEAVRIAVQQPGYVRVGSYAVSVLSVFMPLFALLGLLFFGLWFILLRFAKMRKGVATESAEALAMLHKEFAELRDALAAQTDALRSTRKTKKLTKAEDQLVRTMEKEIADSEQRVAKEIADVKDMIG
tara:strand:+ start:524 stop:2266 length:1743 start_codon:yes stop_codon:yes gene_type:complete